MSPLPQQKKSAEEIAALRGKLGIPAEPDAADTAKAGPAAGVAPSAVALPQDEPIAKLRRADVMESPVIPKPAPRAAAHVYRATPVPDAPVADIDPVTGLPMHRHSDEDLAALRRRGMLETQNEAMHLPVRRAHNMWVVCGYLLAAAAIWPIHQQMPILLPAALCVPALALGLFFFFLRPYSKHHGAFLLVGVFFLLIYAALQYIPQLQHAT